MFPCACSLRSTQCAALIALATAAGLARIDDSYSPAPTAPQSGSSAVEYRIEPRVAVAIFSWARALTVSSAGVRHRAQLVAKFDLPRGLPAQPIFAAGFLAIAEAPSRPTPLRLPTAAVRLRLSETDRIPIYAASIRLPFAVGPPLWEDPLALCIAGTPVPSNSTMYERIMPVRVAQSNPRLRHAPFSPAPGKSNVGSTALRGRQAPVSRKRSAGSGETPAFFAPLAGRASGALAEVSRSEELVT